MLLEHFANTAPLELIAGFGYLFGHFLLAKKKILGWLIKIIGGTAWIIFLFQNKNYIFMAVTVVVVCSMMYGLYKWSTETVNKRTTIDTFFEVVATIVASCMFIHFLLSDRYELGPFIESIIVFAEIFGTVLLARKKIFGWYLYILMSVLAGILVIFVNPNPAVVLGILEMMSIFFYVSGIRNFSKLTSVSS